MAWVGDKPDVRGMRHIAILPVFLAGASILSFLSGCSGGGSSSAIVPNGPPPLGSGPGTTNAASAVPIESPASDTALAPIVQNSALATTSAAAILAATGRVLFADTFGANNTEGWSLVRGAWNTCPQGDGVIALCASDPKENDAYTGSTSWTDYAVSVIVSTHSVGIAAGKRNGVDVLLRAQDPTHFYQLELVNERDGTQQWQIWRRQGGSWTNLARGLTRFTSGVPNILRVQAVGSHLSASISRNAGVSYTVLGSATDSVYAGGSAGLRAWGGMTASFANVVITQNGVPGPPPPTASPAPSSAPAVSPPPSATPVSTPVATPVATPTPISTTPPIGTPYNTPPGTQPFPSGVFDALIANPQIDPNSNTYIANTLGGDPWHLGKLQFSAVSSGRTDAAVPVYVAHQSDPHYRIHCMYYSGCPLEGADVAIPKGARPASNLGYLSFTDDGTHDQHMAVRNVDTGVETDMWLTPQPNDVGGSLNIGYGGKFPFASGGVGQPGATAAGFALTNGRVRSVDLLAGHIPYALFLITPCENGHIAPAIGDDGGRNAGCPPIGARVWLDSSLAQIAASGAAPDFVVILNALHEYGGYIGDRCTQCSLNVSLEGGLTYTSFGLPNPWAQIAAHYPGQTTSGPANEYHILVGTGNIDLSQHLHVII